MLGYPRAPELGKHMAPGSPSRSKPVSGDSHVQYAPVPADQQHREGFRDMVSNEYWVRCMIAYKHDGVADLLISLYPLCTVWHTHRMKTVTSANRLSATDSHWSPYRVCVIHTLSVSAWGTSADFVRPGRALRPA